MINTVAKARSLKANILLIEPDVKQAEVLVGIIKNSMAAEVDATTSPERAFELVSRMDYHVVVANCGSVKMDSLSLVERVKKISPNTSVIITTEFPNVEEAVRSIKAGADEYFVKPIHPDKFVLTIRQAMQSRELIGSSGSEGDMMQLLTTCQIISGSLDQERVLQTVAGFMKRELSPKGLAIYHHETGKELTKIPTFFEIDSEVVDVIVEGKNRLIAENQAATTQIITKTSASPEVFIFRFNSTSNGTFVAVAISPSYNSPHADIETLFRLLAAQIQMTSKNIRSYQGVAHLLHVDEPTGLGNTRYMHKVLDQVIAKFKDGGNKGFSILFIDMDHFKRINDQHGHLIGTKLLLEVGKILKEVAGTEAKCFRYGGDEFVVIVENVDARQGFVIGEGIRNRVQAEIFLRAEKLDLKLTTSIGVAAFPEHASSKADIINAADYAMYVAKRKSRNSVYLATKNSEKLDPKSA